MAVHGRALGPLVLLVLVLVSSCASSEADTWPGREQAARQQAALRRCLAQRGLRYHEVVAPPGEVDVVVPVPAPAAWWADHTGYGLVDGTRAEVEGRPPAPDPNRRLVATAAGRRRLGMALFGPDGTPESFAPTGCFSRSLRAAGRYLDDRSGTGFAVVGLDEPALARRPSVAAARGRRDACLRRRGISIDGAEPRAVLEARFRRAGLITEPGRPHPDADPAALDRARRTERRWALAELRCSDTAGLDRALDTAIRSAVRRSRGANP